MTNYEKIDMAEVAVRSKLRVAKMNKVPEAIANWEEVEKFLAELKQSYSVAPTGRQT